jgi:hypothetical protein
MLHDLLCTRCSSAMTHCVLQFIRLLHLLNLDRRFQGSKAVTLTISIFNPFSNQLSKITNVSRHY